MGTKEVWDWWNCDVGVGSVHAGGHFHKKPVPAGVFGIEMYLGWRVDKEKAFDIQCPDPDDDQRSEEIGGR